MHALPRPAVAGRVPTHAIATRALVAARGGPYPSRTHQAAQLAHSDTALGSTLRVVRPLSGSRVLLRAACKRDYRVMSRSQEIRLVRNCTIVLLFCTHDLQTWLLGCLLRPPNYHPLSGKMMRRSLTARSTAQRAQV